MKKIISITALALIITLLCVMLAACGAARPDGPDEIPTSPLTLTYTAEDGKSVLTVTSDTEGSIYNGAFTRKDNKIVGDEIALSEIEVLRIGDGIARIQSCGELASLEVLDILDGEGLYIETHALFENRNMDEIYLGGGAVELENGGLRLTQDLHVRIKYREGATRYKTKYMFGGHPVEFESDAEIPDMSIVEYAQATAEEARQLAREIADLYKGDRRDFIYMPYGNSIADYSFIKEFTLELTKGASTEAEKVNIIYDYIVGNIVYDDLATNYEPYRVLREGRAVCAGYVGLMHDMLCAVDVASFYTNGFSIDPSLTVENVIAGQNDISEGHAVLAVVWQDGSTSFYDPTFGVVDPEYNKDISNEVLGVRMAISQVDGLEVMIDGVDFTLYTDSSIQFLADDGYIYASELGGLMLDLGSTGEARNYWLSQKVLLATPSNSTYASGGYQPAGTVMTEGISLEADKPSYSLPNGHVISADKAFSFVALESETYGKSIGIDGERVFVEGGIIYTNNTDTAIAVGCLDGVENVVIPATVRGIRVFGVNYSALENKSIRSITLSEGTERLYTWSLDDCIELEYIKLPSTLIPDVPNGPDEVWPISFRGLASLKSVEVAAGNPYLTSKDGVLYNKDMTTLIHYPAAREQDSFTIPASVTRIGEYAFSHARLTSIVWNDAISEIANEAFAYSHLESVTLLAGVNYGSSVFERSRVKSISAEQGVTLVPYAAFKECQSLSEITLPSSINEISGYAFSGCTALYELKLNEGLRSIDKEAFSFTKLGELTLPTTLTSIEDGAFRDCKWLYHLINNSSLPLTSGAHTFGSVAEHAERISRGDVATALRITADGLIFYIGEENNVLLGYLGTSADLVLPESIDGESYTLAYGAFAGVSEWVWWKSTPNSFHSWVFDADHPTMHIRTVTIPKSITYIPDHAFTGLASLRTVYYLGTAEDYANVQYGYEEGSNLEFFVAELVFSE